MDKKEIEKIIKSCFEKYTFEEYLNQFENLIQNLVALDNWISIKDELPKEAKDEEKDYNLKWLICDGNDVKITAEHPSIWNYKSPIDMYKNGEIVTHWQPFPQPPKKK